MRVPPYSLYYRVTSGEVEILRVLHERRNVAGLLGKLLRGGDI
jgi:plasmid stabilization system protein ParE